MEALQVETKLEISRILKVSDSGRCVESLWHGYVAISTRLTVLKHEFMANKAFVNKNLVFCLSKSVFMV